ncbi:EAL domain-containing protein [Marinomonas balearica]|uniref:Diguanylate cyclase/phosphodiesterase n=1 Tax=Marinomonas balearica TaxID=491947 RepID=A0A4R6M7K2_9GAMM|nr:EAL domain-containing protein [Marinomonas balearica]TDO96865.1 diguanylate cyclase/phosphodiesterase [Marinomonas balearica]
MKVSSLAARLYASTFLLFAISGIGFYVVIRSLASVEATLEERSSDHIQSLTSNSQASRQVFDLVTRVQLLEQTILYSESVLIEESFNIGEQLQALKDLSENGDFGLRIDEFVQNFHRFLGSSITLNQVIKELNKLDDRMGVEIEKLDFEYTDYQLERQGAGLAFDHVFEDPMNMIREAYLTIGKKIASIRTRIAPETEKVLIIEVEKELDILMLHLENFSVSSNVYQATEFNRIKKQMKRTIIKYKMSLRKMKANLDQRWIVMDDLVESQGLLLNLVKSNEESVKSSAVNLKLQLEENVAQSRTQVTIVTFCALIFGLTFIYIVVSKHINKPLNRLVRGLRKLEDSDFNLRIDLGRADEWKSIESAFNSMAQRLKESYNQLDTEREKFNYLAHHDPLTGLSNRLLGTLHLKDVIQANKRNRKMFALLYLDLDQFKNVNDSLGHDVGDDLLVNVATTLNEIVSDFGVVARMGGDEFMVILDKVNSIAATEAIAKSINKALRQPYFLNDKTIFVSSSIGICIFPNHGEDVDVLIRNADTAMYETKKHGRDGYRIYTDKLTEAAKQRISISTGLHNAIDQNELDVFYQPQYNLVTGRLVGAEALVRWRHPTKGLLLPVDFIGVAEETGVISEIDDWVFGRVSRDVESWLDAGLSLRDVRISVNISGQKFFSTELTDRLERFKQEKPHIVALLTLEVHEQDVMKNAVYARELIQRLRDKGYKLAIDDIGTGRSSLAFLQGLPLDYMKLDRSVVHNVSSGENDFAFVKAFLSLAQELNIEVIAEGIEEELQAKKLREAGCHVMQGFMYSYPLPRAEWEGVLYDKRGL